MPCSDGHTTDGTHGEHRGGCQGSRVASRPFEHDRGTTTCLPVHLKVRKHAMLHIEDARCGQHTTPPIVPTIGAPGASEHPPEAGTRTRARDSTIRTVQKPAIRVRRQAPHREPRPDAYRRDSSPAGVETRVRVCAAGGLSAHRRGSWRRRTRARLCVRTQHAQVAQRRASTSLNTASEPGARTRYAMCVRGAERPQQHQRGRCCAVRPSTSALAGTRMPCSDGHTTDGTHGEHRGGCQGSRVASRPFEHDRGTTTCLPVHLKVRKHAMLHIEDARCGQHTTPPIVPTIGAPGASEHHPEAGTRTGARARLNNPDTFARDASPPCVRACAYSTSSASGTNASARLLRILITTQSGESTRVLPPVC